MRKLFSLFLIFICVNIHAQVIKIACIGASITAGARIDNPKENSYPGQLQSLLGTKYLVENYGVSGTTMLRNGNSSYWNTKAYQSALISNPNIVFIDLGGNDAKAINRIHFDELEKDCRDMARSFAGLSSHPRVILMLPFVSFVTDSTQIWDPVIVKEIIPRIQKVASEEHLEVLDMHALLLDRADLFPDKIHPDVIGAGIIAKRLFQQIKQE